MTEQAEALIDDIKDNERHEKLYGAFNDSIVSLSTIREFDAKKDWLAKQVAPSSSSSEDDEEKQETSQNAVDNEGIDFKPSEKSGVKKKRTLRMIASEL